MGMVPNGLLPSASAGMTRRLDPERWAVAEDRTAELIACIQPNVYSEGRRLAVYHYVQRLIMNCLSCQVFTFGSVPLKTYLPDGDIDVTAFSNSEELKEIWANLVRDALEREEKDENAEFHVKEVQYIQAEVKIIKCLVENIVVDISFNQVGGLCTLCFLEEIDNLISQNHLFKRSIILIKAWCFYESRILGAHHGLISTYALETLVLYIFHIFNNSFTGPLEVLYRFLEFFSNFDWEKFCLSLWGPVPISSLPDMTAIPPRMDSGELLLNKSFLDTCSSAYGVVPHTQENQGQPFVSKHFNVIDPLRTNNNLGRSVSKGNFFRIRSAFAYGAKRLGKLLECPKEALIPELNQFFTNTWIRHGSGSRPDVPIPSLVDVRPMKVVSSVVSSSQRSLAAFKKKVENPKLHVNQDNLRPNQDNLTGVGDIHYRNLPRTVNPSVSHVQHQKSYTPQGNAKVSEQLERNNSDGLMQSARDKRVPNGLFVNDRNGQNRSRFARTRSSPELTDSSTEGFRGRRTNAVGMEKSFGVDYSRRNILIPEVSSNHSTKSSQDESVSSMNGSSHPSALAASDSNSVSSSFRDDNGFVMNEELPSVSESSDMHHDEQVLANLMESMKLHGFNGQIQLPMQIPSHLSVAHPPLLAPTTYSQKHLAGVPPANLIGTPWLPNMQFLHGFVPPMAHYIHNPNFAPNIEDGTETEKPNTSDVNHDAGKTWQEYGVGFSRHFDPEARDPHFYGIDGKEHSSLPNGVPGAPLERQMKFTVENNVVGDETYTGMFQIHTGREPAVDYSKRSGYGNVPSSHASSSKGKTLDSSSWDEMTVNTTIPPRENWGKRPAFVAPATTTHGNTGWQMGNITEHLAAEVNDGPRNGTVVPIITEASEIVTGSDSFSSKSRTSQVPNELDPSQVGMPNPVFTPFLIGSPQHRQADSSGLTFVPTGPPVPFVVLPFVPGNNDGSGPQFERSEGIDQLPANTVGQFFGSLNDVHQQDSSAISTVSSSTMTEPSGEHKPDILHSDFVSHWHNLQYGRLCQNPRPMGPVLYPVPVPPMYLQGHVPWDGPGRPAAPNVNWTQMVGGQRVFPVMPVQPATERTGVFQHYGEDAPRYRGGTGTYLPNPKVHFRDRHSNSRNYRGGYNGDRGDYNDKEGSWINSKQRNPNRGYGRSQSERSGMRSDRQVTDESRSDRQRRTYRNDSYRHEASSQYLVQGQPFGSTSSMRKPGNTVHGVYTPPSTYSNADGDDIPRSTRQVMPNGFYGQRRGRYRGGSSHSSPDQPSSPQPRR
ncbi:nucleotidyltransferase [Zea mays]|uniref:Nucleotidyltransferase n=1 Tax=Zea mays TaxID=4577 RepID=A0A1D6PHM0_MAIZE|nr:nucleotidyltransferase [Zea mays]